MNINEVVKYIEKELHNKYILNEEKEWVYVEIININRLDVKIVSDNAHTEKEIRTYLEIILNDINIDNNIKLYIGHINLSSIDEAEFLDLKKPSKRQLENPSFGEMIDANINNTELKKDRDKTTSRIISFYSYKGGVGRTIALIQTAYLLAKEGKKVLLMDLDIEAPSFYNIFKDVIKTEHGIVDYLYEDLYFDKKTISVSNIVSKLNLELKGDIYLIPAGKTNLNYVKKLEKLKEKRIYENKSIQNIIKETEKIYGIDYTLVDSRTGINNWGALSLLDISDEVMLFAYPNRENIEGIKLILDIIKEYKNPTIVLSRIDPSNEGKKIAENLFSELDINQEYIPVYYDSSIALAQKHPIDYATKPYEEICKFILEREKNELYKVFIEKNKLLVDEILHQIGDIEELNSIVTVNEEKILHKNNWIIINDNDDIKSLISKVNRKYDAIDNKDALIRLENKEEIITREDVIANVLDMLNKFCRYKYIKKYNLVKNKGQESTDFISFELQDFKTYISRFDEEYMVSNYFDFMRDLFTEEFISNTVYIMNFDEVFGEVDSEYLQLILSLFSFPDVYGMNLKIVVNEEYYIKYLDVFNENSSNILDLCWREGKNSINRIEEILNKSVDILGEKIISEIKNNLINDSSIHENHKNSEIKEDLVDKIFNFLYEEMDKDKSSISGKISNLEDEIRIKDMINRLNKSQNDINSEICNLIYGKRIDSNVYSKYISIWIHDELLNINKLNKKYVLNLISEACNVELSSSNYNKESVITKNSLKKSIINI